MIGSASLKTGAKLSLFLLPLFVLTGLAADKSVEVAPQAAATLAYQFPAGRTLSYKETSTQTQNMDIMGQTMTNESVSNLEFTFKPKGMKGQDHEISVTIDAGKSDIQSPQGNISPDLSAVIGKSFDMILSRLGKEIDVSGATALKIETPGSGQSDISSSFQAFFPDLPDKAVKIGDTWPSEDTIIAKEGNGETKTHLTNQNTFDGMETVDGYECARIKVVAKGRIEGNLEQQGMSIGIGMQLEGQTTWYFAVKEGIYIKADSLGKLSGSFEVGAPANMNVPITGETKQQTRLIKK